MPKSYPEIERRTLELLRAGPMRQVDIVDSFPMELYIVVGHAVRNLDAQGLIAREKCGQTKRVWLKEDSDEEG